MTSNISRRSVAKGAAWSIPAVAVATSAPAMAASSTTNGYIYSVPWSNTYGNFQATSGNDGQYLPYIMYPVPTAGQTGSFNQSTPSSAVGNAQDTASYPTTTQNSSGQYENAAGTPTCYGNGSTITITMTQTSGPQLTQTTPTSDTNAWPFLVPRDGAPSGGCGIFYSVTNSDGTIGDNEQFLGVPSFDANGNATFTWTLTWSQDTCASTDGCSAITYDIHVPATGGGAIGWNIVTISPAGSNTVTV